MYYPLTTTVRIPNTSLINIGKDNVMCKVKLATRLATHCSWLFSHALIRFVIYNMRRVLCGLRYHDHMLSMIYSIGPTMHALSNQRYRHYMLSSRQINCPPLSVSLSLSVSIVVILITTRLGVLVLIRNTPLLCFSLGWLLLVALLLPFIILLCGS